MIFCVLVSSLAVSGKKKGSRFTVPTSIVPLVLSLILQRLFLNWGSASGIFSLSPVKTKFADPNKERERRAHFHESRSMKETRSGARIWATNDRESIIHSVVYLHTINFEYDKKKRKKNYIDFWFFSDLICFLDKQLGLRKN